MKFIRTRLRNQIIGNGLGSNRINSGGSKRTRNAASIIGLLLISVVSFGALFGLHGTWYYNYADNTPTILTDAPPSDDKPQAASPGTRRAEVVTKDNIIVVAHNSSGEGQEFSTVECNIDEFFGLDEAAKARGSERPVVLRRVWNPPNLDWETEAGFLGRYSDVPFYIKDNFVQVKNDKCVAPFEDLWKFITSPGNTQLKRSMLAFTNDQENPAMFGELNYDVPDPVKHIDSFAIVSTMTKGQSHEFHRHGESWIGQAAGHKVWWFLPPDAPRPTKVNACDYLTSKEVPPKGTTTCIQSPGDVIWFGKSWYHATCSLTDWNVALGRQLGPRINQKFKTLPMRVDEGEKSNIQSTLEKCSGESTMAHTQKQKETASPASSKGAKESDWKWYDGDLGKYYDDLEVDHKRDAKNINDYAVHRWLGEKKSTQVHYELIHESIMKHSQASKPNRRILDAGCGLGSALMWMEKQQPSWKLEGRTLSKEQASFINTKLPAHNFQIQLESYDNLEKMYDALYSIEAAIHSTDIKTTLKAWSDHLDPDGVVVLIDDFLLPGVAKDDPDVDLFARSWLANSLYTVTKFDEIARQYGLYLVESRDLLAEYRVVHLNYRNKVPSLDPGVNRNHQGWMGSKYRQKLTVEGKLGYNLVVFRKMAQSKQA